MLIKVVIFFFIVLLSNNVWCHIPDDTLYEKNCKHLFDLGYNRSGIYTIQPNKNVEPFMVLCDMEIDGGGWTHIHKRFDGSQNFDRNWTDYKYGFGNLDTEFWLGLEYMYQLTGHHLNELLIEVMDADDIKTYARYEHFSIGSKSTQYSIKVLGNYNGTAGDSFSSHSGLKFSTRDKRNDNTDANDNGCALDYYGGWWYSNCFECNLNGNEYSPGRINNETNYGDGFIWSDTKFSLKSARMLIRPLIYNQQKHE